jgi:hypothetical protein
MIFLIQYDRSKARLIGIQEYADADREKADRTRLKLELDSLDRGVDMEILLFDSQSEEVLRQTHRRYFESAEQVLEGARAEINSIEFNGHGPGNGKNGS